MGVPVQTAFSRARLEAVDEVASAVAQARQAAVASAVGNPMPGVGQAQRTAEENERAIEEHEREKSQPVVEGSQVTREAWEVWEGAEATEGGGGE